MVGNYKEQYDEKLTSWKNIEDEYLWNLLLGNGFSTNIDKDFSYSSLFEEAKANFGVNEIGLFKKFDTKNFEEILNVLEGSIGVSEVYRKKVFTLQLKKSEKKIRNTLVSTIEGIHTPFRTEIGK